MKDDSTSRLIEDEAAQRLRADVPAIAGNQLGIFPGTDIETLRSKLPGAGIDAVVITRLVAIDEQDAYRPPQTYFADDHQMLSPYYRDFWRFYSYAVSNVTDPASRTSRVRETRYVIETILYRLPQGTPARSAVSESLNPASTLLPINEIVRLVHDHQSRAGRDGAS